MRTLRLSLTGTVILVLLGGLGGVVVGQQSDEAAGSANVLSATSVWTSKGDEAAPFTNLNSVNIDPDGNLWVLDGPRGQFQILGPDGAFIESWGTPGTGDGEFDFVRPDGLAYGDLAFAPDGGFYVGEGGTSRVQRFDADRDFVTSWGGKGDGEGRFIFPTGLAVAPDGNVYVADDERDIVQVFDPDGAFLFAFGETGSGPGQLNDAGFIDIAPDGTVFIGEFGNHRISVFDPDGTFLWQWGSSGDGPYAFSNPHGIAVGADGLVYLADFRNLEVKVFDSEGQHLATWPDPADDEGTLNISTPVGIDVDDEGNIYISEYFTAQVRKLATERTPVDE
jgi:DNA-binding beta-propeller fold protein YncE